MNLPQQVVAYVASQELAKISSLLPSNKNRSFVVHSLVSALGLLAQGSSGTRRIQAIKPSRASYADLSVYHSRDYLDFILNADSAIESSSEFGIEDDCPPFPGLHDYVPLVAGATLAAVKTLKHRIANIAICWDGGRHHAQKSHAAGFCYVADCVLAILALKRPLPPSAGISLAPVPVHKPRIMYLDLDLHFSDAVSQAFSSPNPSVLPQVLTFSIHHDAPGFFPASPLSQLPSVTDDSFDPFSLSLPLRQGAHDKTFARIWPIVEQVRDAFQPHFVVVQCGTDGLAGDPCAVGNWSLGDGDGSFGWCIARILDDWPGRKLLLGGGGYNSANTARAWAYLTSVALGHPLSLETGIPDHTAFPLYEPSFTLDVPAGNMRDHNTEEYIHTIETCFVEVIKAIKHRLQEQPS